MLFIFYSLVYPFIFTINTSLAQYNKPHFCLLIKKCTKKFGYIKKKQYLCGLEKCKIKKCEIYVW